MSNNMLTSWFVVTITTKSAMFNSFCVIFIELFPVFYMFLYLYYSFFITFINLL